ncbi:MAG: hypothetical protein OXH68_16995 [Gammaproteobacteria bacterium]|nr:hypothetical protein [Gammaproteobacteria bacterium]
MLTLTELVDGYMERKYEPLHLIFYDVFVEAQRVRAANPDDTNAALIEAHVELASLAATLVAGEIESGLKDDAGTMREQVFNAALVAMAAWHSLQGADLGEHQNRLARVALVETINVVMQHVERPQIAKHHREIWGDVPRRRSRALLARMERLAENA